MLVAYAGLLALTYQRLAATPTGLLPQLDRGYFIAAFQLPPGSTLDRSDAIVRKASELMLDQPGVRDAVAFVGFDGATFTNAPNTGVIFVALKSFEERKKLGVNKDQILAGATRQDVRAARGLRVRARAALGARHRHRWRPQGLCAGPRGTRPAGARRRRPGRWPAPPGRFQASSSRSRCSTRARRRSMPTSTAPRPSSSACRSPACSRRSRSTWARPSSTTSIFSAAPTA